MYPLKLGIRVDDLHRPSAKHKLDAQDRVAELARRGKRFGFVGCDSIGRWGILSLWSMAEKSFRSSATSISCGDVPMILTPFFCKPSARFKGVCPPN